jgi:hypothetical protein
LKSHSVFNNLLCVFAQPDVVVNELWRVSSRTSPNKN